MLTALVLGIILSLDSLSVSLASGIAYPFLSVGRKFMFSTVLAFVQFCFFLSGQAIAKFTFYFINGINSWLAFFLLGFLGVKMILENEQANVIQDIKLIRMFLFGIATSVDALIVGFGISGMNKDNYFLSAVVIGAVTFVFSNMGFNIGKAIGLKWMNIARYISGAILLLLAIKILLF